MEELVAEHGEALTPYMAKQPDRPLAVSGVKALSYLHDIG